MKTERKAKGIDILSQLYFKTSICLYKLMINQIPNDLKVFNMVAMHSYNSF